MNTMRSLSLLIAAITLGGFTACNYSSECWYYGEGSENAGAGPGGGVIIPTGPAGAGGYGEAPRDAGAPLECNEPEEEPDKENDDSPDGGSYEAGPKVFCLKKDHGAVCSERCMAKGIGCVALAVHPHKTDGGIGRLYGCNTLFLGFMCSYAYPNGDSCHYTFGNPFPNTCTYTGKD
jgi:hypothetical protein